MATPIQYASFLIRIWRETRAGETTPSVDWHAEVEHIQSNQYWVFKTEEELLVFLQQQSENIPADPYSGSNKSILHEAFSERQKE